MSLSIKFYRNLSIVLLAINIALLAFFFFMAPPRPQHQHAKELMNFDQQQDSQFKESVQQHKKKMATYNQQQHQLIEQYFSPLISPYTAVASDSILTAIKSLEQEKIEATYQHFQEIKALLKKEQQPSFENFVDKAMSRILKGGKKRKH